MRWIVLLALLATPAAAQTMRGAGAHPCSVWLGQRVNGGHAYEDEAWILGYISGTNAAGRGGALFAREDNRTIYGEIDRYCTERPGDTLWSAVRSLLGGHDT